jgi:hypothetical protein
MKYPALLTFLFLAQSVIAQPLNCSEFRKGIFQFEGFDGSSYTINRNDSTQTENSSRSAGYSLVDVKWISECTYILSNTRDIRRNKPAVADTATIATNQIFRIDNHQKFFVKTWLNTYPDTIITVFYKIDTSLYYNYLPHLPGFSEYKDSKNYGQTMLGENHSIDYYQSNKDKEKFIIAFETTFEGPKYNKSRLLDSITVRVKAGEAITNSNCRYLDKFDDEICVIYRSTDAAKEAGIQRAFRCNRKTGMIEEIAVGKVKYKEADRLRVKFR